MAEQDRAVFNTPIPKELQILIVKVQAEARCENRAEFLMRATNALAKEVGMTPVSVRIMRDFVPYPPATANA